MDLLQKRFSRFEEAVLEPRPGQAGNVVRGQRGGGWLVRVGEREAALLFFHHAAANPHWRELAQL